MMERERIAILFGGPSPEHEISIMTALQALRGIDPKKYDAFPVYISQDGRWFIGDALADPLFYRSLHFGSVEEVTLLPKPSERQFTSLQSQRRYPVDFCLLAFHGRYGEDGSIQGLFELTGIPYSGSNVLASSLSMNKYLSKELAKSCGVLVLPSCVVHKKEAKHNLQQVRERILSELSFPLFVKPNHLGSSVGIAAAHNLKQLDAALAKVFLFDTEALIEPYCKEITEINVAVLDGSPPEASVVEIPIATGDALSYEDKYLRGGSKGGGERFDGMAGLSRVIDPSDLDPQIKERVQKEALKIFLAIGCSGVCRFDFILDPSTGQLYFNEVNPIPGSFAYYLWSASTQQLLYPELMERLILLGQKRAEEKLSLKTNFGFHALQGA